MLSNIFLFLFVLMMLVLAFVAPGSSDLFLYSQRLEFSALCFLGLAILTKEGR